MSDREQLHHLLGRTIDGVALHGESDRLRELVRDLEQRAEQAEAAIERVRNYLEARLDQVAVDPAEVFNVLTGAAALDQPQQPTLPGDHRTCCTARIGHHPTCRTNQQQPTTTEAPTR